MNLKGWKMVQLTFKYMSKLPYIEVREQVEMGGHTFWPFSMITLLSKKYFTMNAIHEIPETMIANI